MAFESRERLKMAFRVSDHTKCLVHHICTSNGDNMHAQCNMQYASKKQAIYKHREHHICNILNSLCRIKFQIIIDVHVFHLRGKENICWIKKDLLTKVGTVQGKNTFFPRLVCSVFTSIWTVLPSSGFVFCTLYLQRSF